MTMRRRTWIQGAAGGAVAVMAGPMASAVASAQAKFPSRPVTIVVPFGPGGATDLTARLVAEKLSAKWGQPVLIENRPGAGGNLGSALVAKAAPDGYTLVLGVTGSHGINISLMPSMPYHPLRDFVALTQATTFPNAVAVHPGVPVRNLKELIELARAQPGRVSYGSDGNGTASHLGMELIKAEAKVFMVHIPYRGGAAMLQDLGGRQIDAGLTGLPAALPLAKAGKIRILAVTTAARVPAAPDVPTVAEQGFPGYVAAPWSGFFAPKGLSPALTRQIAADLAEALSQADVRSRLAAGGASVVASAPDGFRSFVDQEIGRWAKAIKASGTTL